MPSSYQENSPKNPGTLRSRWSSKGPGCYQAPVRGRPEVFSDGWLWTIQRIMLLSLNKSTEFHKIHNLQSMKIIISPLVIFLVTKVKTCDWGDNSCFPNARMSSLTHPLSPSSSPLQPWQFLCPSFCLSLILSIHLPLPISVFLPLSLCLSLSPLSLTCSFALFASSLLWSMPN